MLTLDRTDALGESDRLAVRELGRAVYPPGSFDDWPGLSMEWDSPEWCVRLSVDDALVAYAGLYSRRAKLDGDRDVLVGGLGNVKTHPDHRRRGHAGDLVRRAGVFFREHGGVDFGVLVCEPELVRFYASLGWHEFAGKLIVRQRGEPVEFTLCRVMTLGVEMPAVAEGTIDLCGPPW